MGTKATIEAARTPVSSAVRDLYAWHGDTYVSGPSWTEFTRAMGIDKDSGKTSGSVYRVSVYRAVAGHREQLEKLIGQFSANAAPAGQVLTEHLEGAPWNFLGIMRFNSWTDFATYEEKSRTQTAAGQGSWFEVREHSSFHTDTLAERIAP
jgi:hypothetical protein